jgi:hypothetical protein
MIRGIDHLVIACEDPDAAAAELESSLGLKATGGGRHERLGTFNRIAWLADGSFLELIGVEDETVAEGNPIGGAVMRSLRSGGGLATYALLDDDLEVTAGTLAAAGTFGPVTAGSRRRPDGELVEWWVSVPDVDLGPTVAPFLIQHAYTGAEWGLAALDERARFQHPIGSPVALARLDIATPEPPSAAATIHEQLGIDFWSVADLAVAQVGSHVLRFVPRGQVPVPAIVTLAAEIEAPRTAELLGLRFDVERAELPVTSGRG